jgi:hypothetical protein
MIRSQSRLPASLYVAGPFAMGYTEFYLIPLYGLSLGCDCADCRRSSPASRGGRPQPRRNFDFH